MCMLVIIIIIVCDPVCKHTYCISPKGMSTIMSIHRLMWPSCRLEADPFAAYSTWNKLPIWRAVMCRNVVMEKRSKTVWICLRVLCAVGPLSLHRGLRLLVCISSWKNNHLIRNYLKWCLSVNHLWCTDSQRWVLCIWRWIMPAQQFIISLTLSLI